MTVCVVVQLCIHAPKTSHGRSSMKGSPSPADMLGSWGQLLAELDRLRMLLQANEVPPFLQRKLFMQLFSFMNVQLFNQLLLRRECCSFANGEYVKHGLAQVENWISVAGDDCMGNSWEELRYIRQVRHRHQCCRSSSSVGLVTPKINHFYHKKKHVFGYIRSNLLSSPQLTRTEPASCVPC